MGKQVFIFGAGASVHAGAPISRELMLKIMEYVETKSSIVQYQCEQVQWLKDYLQKLEFDEWKDNFDIEMFCTMLDFLNFDFHIQSSKKDLSGKFAHILGKNAFEVEQVLKIIKILITHILSPVKIKDEKEILRLFLEKYVKEGDMLLTFNYDLLLDQALWDASLWSPHKGYAVVNNDDIPEEFKKRNSKITYLKLHGSVNWIKTLDFYSWEYYDKATGESYFKDVSNLQNKVIPGWVGNQSGSIFYPTYLKNLDKADIIKKLWAKAFKEIQKAEKVWIIGYSIPDADILAHFLLMNMPASADIIIINPDAKKIKEKIENKLYLKNRKQLRPFSLSEVMKSN